MSGVMTACSTVSTVDRAALERVLDNAAAARSRLRHTPVQAIVTVLARCGETWADPDSIWRRQAMAHLPGLLRFSPEMVARGLDLVVGMLRPEALWARLSREVIWPQAMHGWVHPEPGESSWVRAEPLGVVLHVASGNVFVATAVTLTEGLLTRNVSILKASSADRVFPELFWRSLQEADQDGVLAGACHVVHWPGGTRDLEALCKERCNGILVWGGQAAIREYSDGLSPTTRLIPYGPRLSFAAISRDAMQGDVASLARRLAADVVLWDQQSCASPQLVYVEDGHEVGDNARRLLDELPSALESAAQELPAAALDADEMAELTKVREVARMDMMMEEAVLRTPGPRLDWTLIHQKDPRFDLSCLFRTLLVKNVPRLEDIAGHAAPVRGYLQTVALAANPVRRRVLADVLAELGATRIVPLGHTARIGPGEPHDGQLALERLIRWVTLTDDEEVKNRHAQHSDR